MRSSIIAALALVGALGACAHVDSDRAQGERPGPQTSWSGSQRSDALRLESLVAVLADPSRYHGKPVGLHGVIRLEFEGDELCLDQASMVHGITQNCLWLELEEGSMSNSYDEMSKWNGHYVYVEGEIDAERQGHFRLYRASIVNVLRVAILDSVDP